MIRKTFQRLPWVTVAVLVAMAHHSFAQSATGSITGTVTDPAGAVVAGAVVSYVGPDGKSFRSAADGSGYFEFRGLLPGKYALTVSAVGFDAVNQQVEVLSGKTEKTDVRLTIAHIEAKLNVTNNSDNGTDPSANAGAIVLKEKDLETYSEDPDELKLQLQALAGAGPGGVPGQIYVNGFSATRLPPKSAIREIRINQDPFSAEYDQPGFGRIEVFTKPGSAQFRSLFSWRFNHSAFNAVGPFSQSGAPYHTTLFSGDFGGPLTRKASFQFDIDRNSISDNSGINAIVLDEHLNAFVVNQTTPNPRIQTIATLRVDYQLSLRNTLLASYQYYGDDEKNDGVGSLSLASQAFNLFKREHTLQFSNTTVVNPRMVHELRFEYRQAEVQQLAQSSQPQLTVLGAFIGGGNSIGRNITAQQNYQLQDFVSIDRQKRFFKIGGQLRVARETDSTTGNFNGSFTFPSLPAFQITERGLRDGLTPTQIRAAGGGAAQFSITTGRPLVSNTMVDAAIFFLENWKLRPNVTFSYGFRYENQNQISDALDFAPRAGLAWGIHPGKSGNAKTVLRLGAGVFYTRFGQSLALNSLQLNGSNQSQFIIQNPDFFPVIPDDSTLATSLVKPTIYQTDPKLRAPLVTQTSISIERKLPRSTSLAITYLNSHGSRQLLSRNVNAPLAATFGVVNPSSGVRPFPNSGNIYEYESRGRFQQNQVTVGVQIDGLDKARLNANYILNFAKSNTGGANRFPSNQYDIEQDYGRADYDVRHQFNFGGQIDIPFGAYINPFLIVSSGQPYSITLGRDLNGDSIFNDRPAFATDLSRASVVATRFGFLDTSPLPGQTIVPRNLGTGPPKFALNLRLVKAFALGNKEIKPARPDTAQGNNKQRSIYRNAWQPMYAIRFELIVNNIFNRTNFATPIGNLNSSFFGKPVALAGSPFSTASSTRQIFLRTVFRF